MKIRINKQGLVIGILGMEEEDFNDLTGYLTKSGILFKVTDFNTIVIEQPKSDMYIALYELSKNYDIELV